MPELWDDRWRTPLYLDSTDSPLNTGASAKRDDGDTLVVAQGCQAADLVRILRPHHNIGRLAPRSRQASEVSKGVPAPHPLISRNLEFSKDLRTGPQRIGTENTSLKRTPAHSKQVARDQDSPGPSVPVAASDTYASTRHARDAL